MPSNNLYKDFKTLVYATVIFATLFSNEDQVKDVNVSVPAQNGVLIYSSNLRHLAEFYEQLFGMRVARETREFKNSSKDS